MQTELMPAVPALATSAFALVPQSAPLPPPAASNYLGNRLGRPIAVQTLAKWRVLGGGPAFRKAGRRVVYEVSSLDAWAAARLGPPQTSTSDAGSAA
jgi:hypothetical protein